PSEPQQRGARLVNGVALQSRSSLANLPLDFGDYKTLKMDCNLGSTPITFRWRGFSSGNFSGVFVRAMGSTQPIASIALSSLAALTFSHLSATSSSSSTLKVTVYLENPESKNGQTISFAGIKCNVASAAGGITGGSSRQETGVCRCGNNTSAPLTYCNPRGKKQSPPTIHSSTTAMKEETKGKKSTPPPQWETESGSAW
ncbi:unnamed protein product, partial [Linum tenue]